jgi:hypothetical protein
MRRLAFTAAVSLILGLSAAASAQPLEPLEADVEAIVFGTWVQASISLETALYEEDVTKALQRCHQSMFTVADDRLEALFPSAEQAQGDLSLFPFDDGIIVAEAGATTPRPTRLAAGQLRTEDSLMLRLSMLAFWDGYDRQWVEMTFANPLWGDLVFMDTERSGRNYTMLMMMRYNGDTGLYVKCEE